MTRDELFDIWAPAASPWSLWAKPVLFAHWPRPLPADSEPTALDLSWVPAPGGRVALLVDLPGAASVHFGLAVAAIGYRPVPLFNAIPPPLDERPAVSVVSVQPIMAALVAGADRLRATSPPADAPPAFLIDSARSTQTTPDLPPGTFDNRSVVFVTDVPSAVRLAAQGIRRAILVQAEPRPLVEDLEDLLRTWRTDGLRLDVKWLSQPGPSVPLELPRRTWWALLRRRLTRGRPRMTAAGEFGAFIPHPSTG
jgi:hypothetical protein